MAPASGWPKPHNKFCKAIARLKTLRPQAKSWPIGLMKKPTLERGPKESNAIAQPQAMMTSGVRQLEAAGAGRRSPTVVDIKNSPVCSRRRLLESVAAVPDELMHLHEKPSVIRWKFCFAEQPCKTLMSTTPN